MFQKPAILIGHSHPVTNLTLRTIGVETGGGQWDWDTDEVPCRQLLGFWLPCCSCFCFLQAVLLWKCCCCCSFCFCSCFQVQGILCCFLFCFLLQLMFLLEHFSTLPCLFPCVVQLSVVLALEEGFQGGLALLEHYHCRVVMRCRMSSSVLTCIQWPKFPFTLRFVRTHWGEWWPGCILNIALI